MKSVSMKRVFTVIFAVSLLCPAVNAAPEDLDFFTDFEGINQPVGVPFSVGNSPMAQATFSGDAFSGVAGIAELYFSGTHAWMVTGQGLGRIEFDQNASQVEFWARTRRSADGTTVITAFDDADQVVDMVTLSSPDPFQLVSFSGNINRIEVINNATSALNGIDDFGFTPLAILGDFDRDGLLNVADLDLLSAEVRQGGADPAFDVTGDGQINQQDRTHWVEVLANTFFGDANLDGQFDSSDLVQVFQRGQYEDGISGNSMWSDGDWDGDGDFGSGDLIVAFQGGSFDQGPRPSAFSAVPEPSAVLLLSVALVTLAAPRSKRFGQRPVR